MPKQIKVKMLQSSTRVATLQHGPLYQQDGGGR